MRKINSLALLAFLVAYAWAGYGHQAPAHIVQHSPHKRQIPDSENPQKPPKNQKTSQSQEESSYSGFQLLKPIHNVRVKPCISLGQPCNARIAGLIRQSDQFVVAFMYRLDSPVIIEALAVQQLAHMKNLTSLHSGRPVHTLTFSPTTTTTTTTTLSTATPSTTTSPIVPALQIPLPIVLAFLDHKQSMGTSYYHNYINRLIDSVPTSLVKLGSKNFHQKVIICKSRGYQAVVIVGSANATYEAENEHSEDMVMIQSNDVAKIYLEEFYKLFRNPLHERHDVGVISHLHRVQPHTSNTAFLPEFIQLLKKTDRQDAYFKEHAHLASITTLGISTGFAAGGSMCLKALMEGLENPPSGQNQSVSTGQLVPSASENANKLLFFFQNYMTSPTNQKYGELWNVLKHDTPTLLVLDQNSKEGVEEEPAPTPTTTITTTSTTSTPIATAVATVRKSGNEATIQQIEQTKGVFPALQALLFKPYTGRKFHHKLVIQYPQKGDPVLYTGSFHLSDNALKSNSETIIGIQSAPLASEYLASILWQSGLGQEREVWEFISQDTSLAANQNIQTARGYLRTLTDMKMEGYYDRFDFVMMSLISLWEANTVSSDSGALTALQELKEFQKDFGKKWEKEPPEGRMKLLSDGRTKIFQLAPYIRTWFEEKATIIRNALAPAPSVWTFPTSPEDIPNWLPGAEKWLADILPKIKKNTATVKETTNTMDFMIRHLKNAETYPKDFEKLLNFNRLFQSRGG